MGKQLAIDLPDLPPLPRPLDASHLADAPPLPGPPDGEADLGCRVAVLEARVKELERELAQVKKTQDSLRKQVGVFWGKFAQLEGARRKARIEAQIGAEIEAGEKEAKRKGGRKRA